MFVVSFGADVTQDGHDYDDGITDSTDDLIGRAPSGHEKVPRSEGRGKGELGQKACGHGAAGEVAERVFALPA